MSYRTPKAQNFHSSLMALIREHSSEKRKLDVETSALELDFESITELSINGHSHLIDALHLPSEIIGDKEQASRVAHYLMGLLISKAKTISGAINCLLLQKNNDGFTPLHQALKPGNVDNMRAYFAEVRQAVTDKTITPQEYKQLLTGANGAGFTPLHEALISGNTDNMRAYFAEVRQAVTDLNITLQEYKRLLTGANDAGFTPLHEALISGNADNMRVYFAEVRQAVTDKTITPQEYKQLLTGTCTAGFTPLHQALKSGNTDNMRAYFAEVRQAVTDQTITSQEYKRLLTGANDAGFTPLHDALKSGNADNMRAYFAEVCQEVADLTITPQEYKWLLTGGNAAGFTPLHQAAISGNYEIYLEYRKALTEFDRDGSLTRMLLFAKTKNGYMPSCQPRPNKNKNDCDRINRELNAQRAKFGSQDGVAQTAFLAPGLFNKPRRRSSAGADNSKFVVFPFTGANAAGFTPLQEALISGNVAKLRAYFAQVYQAVTDGIITPQEYEHLLTGVDAAGFTPLHYAANSGNSEIYLQYRKALAEFDRDGSLTCMLLFAQTRNGDMPSCQPGLNKNKSVCDWINGDLNAERDRAKAKFFGPQAVSSAQLQGLFKPQRGSFAGVGNSSFVFVIPR